MSERQSGAPRAGFHPWDPLYQIAGASPLLAVLLATLLMFTGRPPLAPSL
jgi:hypothetical protein